MKAALMKSLDKFEENSKPKLLFFLTDGEPTDAQWSEIHKTFEEKNHDIKSIVFSFAIGSGTVRRTSLMNRRLWHIIDALYNGSPSIYFIHYCQIHWRYPYIGNAVWLILYEHTQTHCKEGARYVMFVFRKHCIIYPKALEIFSA